MSRMAVLFSLILLSVSWYANLFAQKPDDKSKKVKPNFSGSWVSDPKKSHYELPNDNLDPLSLRRCSFYLTISHTEPEISIAEKTVCDVTAGKTKSTKVFEKVSTYFSDGRGEINRKAHTKTYWKKDRLVIAIDDKQPDTDLLLQIVLSLSNKILTEKITLRSKGDSSFSQDRGVGIFLGGEKTIVFKLKE